MLKRIKPVFGIPRIILDWLAHSPWVSFVLIFGLNFAVRINDLMKIPAKHLVPDTQWELGAIAISLLKTGQFANPYMIETGPTAHLPPVYPAIFALIYYLFGLTSQAGYISLGFIAATNSIMYAIIPWLGAKLGADKGAGLMGGLAGACMLEWSAHGEGLTGVVLGLLLVAFLQRWNNGQNSLFSSLLLGLGIGASFHLQPVLLIVVLGCLAFEIWWRKNQRKFAYTSILILGILLACVPWAWRNYTVFNEFFFIRSNLGLELRMGNHEGAYPAMEVMDAHEEHIHPRTHLVEARKLREIGEIAYMNGALNDALTWIKSNPGEFTRLTGLRVLHIWFGPLHDPKAAAQTSAMTVLAFLGLWHSWRRISIPQRAILLIPLVTYPLIYYLVAYMPRYRTPIDWLIFMLAGVEIWFWISFKKTIIKHDYE